MIANRMKKDTRRLPQKEEGGLPAQFHATLEPKDSWQSPPSTQRPPAQDYEPAHVKNI
jgi:hypothetical protein